MKTSYAGYQCQASSWKGEGASPHRNLCTLPSTTPHSVHRDACGNNFDDQGLLFGPNSNQRWEGK